MDPLSAGLSILSVGLQLFGGTSSIFGSNKADKINQQIYQEQQKAEQVRRQAMELNASRQQTENVRNMQRARSMALNAATNQGAQFGTGLSGGYGQISGQSNWNALGISQNLGFGEQMFDINGRVSGLQSQLSGIKSDMATNQGLASFGGAIAGLSSKGFVQGFGTSTSGPSGTNWGYMGNPSYQNTGGYY